MTVVNHYIFLVKVAIYIFTTKCLTNTINVWRKDKILTNSNNSFTKGNLFILNQIIFGKTFINSFFLDTGKN